MRALRCSLAAPFLLFLASCSSKPKDAIIGKWEDADGTSLVVEFSKDGTVTLSDRKNNPIKGKYAFTGEDQVEIDDPDSKIPKMIFKVSLSRNELTMSDFQAKSRLVSFHDGKLLYTFPPGGEDRQRRSRVKFKRLN